jgi:peroxiredoxin
MMKLFLSAMLICLTLNTRAEMAASPEAVTPLKVGQVVPDVMLTRLDGSSARLAELAAGHKTVLVFFRGGWCPYCTKHLAALKDVLPALQEQGFEVIAISPDTIESNQGAVNEHDIPFTVVSDASFQAMEAFGLAFQLDVATIELYRGYGISLTPHPETGAYQLPVPAVFLVSQDGTIRYRYYQADYKTRLDPTVLLDEAAAIGE